MRTFDRDYEYLLLNLIPQHRLGLERRKHVEKAIRRGQPTELRHVAVSALEDLCARGFFERSDTEMVDGDVLVTYVKQRGRYQIRLRIPVEQWRQFGIAPKATVGASENAQPALPAVDATFKILPDIIRSLYVNNRRESTLERLESIVRLLPQWLDLQWARLIVSEERLGTQEDHNAWVTTMAERTILTRAVYERCRRSGEPEFLDAPAATALGIADPPPGNQRGGEQVAVAPVFSVGEFWGILEAGFPQAPEGNAMRARIEVATGMIEQIVENTIRLETLTSIDKLTSVYNRNHYESEIQIEIERATRSESKLSMLIVDIDDFKRINDTLGHRKGDEALALVAELIKGNLRKIDLPFRYGGEEFVVLLPGTSEVDAAHTAERLRSVIADCNDLTDAEGQPVPLRVSIGGSVFPDHAGTEEELFAKADAALYRAKRKGKNRVEFHRDA